MGVTAENLAEEFGISRADSDAYALQSQARWADAHAKGRYDDEISPIELTSRKGSETFSVDEHPRMTPPEKMASLPTTFKKGGVVTAASASGICDGAASLVVASAEAAAEHGLQPIAELVSWASVGVEPSRMGIGPVPAIEAALERAGLRLDQMGLVEVNEASLARPHGSTPTLTHSSHMARTLMFPIHERIK